jgi:hypothetical protein
MTVVEEGERRRRARPAAEEQHHRRILASWCVAGLSGQLRVCVLVLGAHVHTAIFEWLRRKPSPLCNLLL